MADPIRYVQLDCHLDEKFEYIEAEFGLEGFAIIVKLLQRIYGGQGYYCEWSDRVALLFARKIGAGVNVVREVVSSALKEHIFDEEIFQKYGVLTSHGIQKRFADVAKRRAVIFDKPEYVIDTCAQISEDVYNQAPNVCNSGENACNETTREEKRSKAKLSEEKESCAAAAPPSPPSLKDFLFNTYGTRVISGYEKRADKWAAKSGKDKYELIAQWIEQDGVKPQEGFQSSFDAEEIRRHIHKQHSGAAASHVDTGDLIKQIKEGML